MLRKIRTLALLAAALGFTLASAARADSEHHLLWKIHGKRNTVYLLGSIHVLRERDYPLPPPLMEAYEKSKSVVMEIDLNDLDSMRMQQEMIEAATLPDGKTLHDILGAGRYSHAKALAADVGVDLETFDQFAPWFVAEAISQLQLMQLGFDPAAGVEMYFLGRARSDSKSTGGLETAHDQIALFESMSEERQADYLLSSLEEAKALPTEVNAMVAAWRRGDTAWFDAQMEHEFGRDPRLFQSVLAARNRKWIPRIEALLNDDKNYLVIVGAGHLVGHDSVIDLLQHDGLTVQQQ